MFPHSKRYELHFHAREGMQLTRPPSDRTCLKETLGESHFSVLPLPLSFVRSCESKGCPNSGFDRGVGVRGRGRYPLKPSIFPSTPSAAYHSVSRDKG